MDRYIKAVADALACRNWHAALSTAMTMPDICMWLELGTPSKKDKSDTYEKRYVRWYDLYMQARYTTYISHWDESLRPAPLAGPSTRQQLASHNALMQAYMASRRSVPTIFLNGYDFYGLRCAVLHEGISANQKKPQRVLDRFLSIRRHRAIQFTACSIFRATFFSFRWIYFAATFAERLPTGRKKRGKSQRRLSVLDR